MALVLHSLLMSPVSSVSLNQMVYIVFSDSSRCLTLNYSWFLHFLNKLFEFYTHIFPRKVVTCLLLSVVLNAVFFLTDSSSSQSPGQPGELVISRAPSPPSSGPPAEPSSAPPPEHHRPVSEPHRPKDTPLPLPYVDKNRGSDLILSKKPSSLLNSMRPPAHLKDSTGNLNGRTKTWESFTAEEFAQQFHESVLQSTQKALQKHKGGLFFLFCLD